MKLQDLINVIRSIDVSLADTFVAFNRNGVIDVEKFMQLFVQDTFEDMDFMAQPFLDAIEILATLYHGMQSYAPESFGALHHATVDEFRKYGFLVEDRTVNEEEVRVIKTDNVLLIIERWGDDEPVLDTGEQDEDDDN
jgi:hypothetical protein